MSVTCENIGISGCSSFHFGKMLQVDGEFVQYPFWWQVTGSDLLIHEYTGRTYSVEGGAVYLPVLEGCKCGGNGDPSDCRIDFSITEELSNTPKGDWLGTSGFAISTICKDIGTECGQKVSMDIDFKIERPCDDGSIGYANPINVFNGISYQDALVAINNLNTQLQDFVSYAIGKQFTFSAASDCMGNTLGGGIPVTIIDIGTPTFNEFLIQSLAGATVAMRVTISDNCGNSVTKEQSTIVPNVYKYIFIEGAGVSSNTNPTVQSSDINDLNSDRMFYNAGNQVTFIADRFRVNCGPQVTPYPSVSCIDGSVSLKDSYINWGPVLSPAFPLSDFIVFDGQSFGGLCYSMLFLKINSIGCDVYYSDHHAWQDFCAGFYANAFDVNSTDYCYYLVSVSAQYLIKDPVIDLGW